MRGPKLGRCGGFFGAQKEASSRRWRSRQRHATTGGPFIASFSQTASPFHSWLRCQAGSRGDFPLNPSNLADGRGSFSYCGRGFLLDVSSLTYVHGEIQAVGTGQRLHGPVAECARPLGPVVRPRSCTSELLGHSPEPSHRACNRGRCPGCCRLSSGKTVT